MDNNRKAMYELCSLYYDKNTLAHAVRVAKKAESLIPLFDTEYYNKNTINNFVYNLGLAHDLYEDTKIKTHTWFGLNFESNLILLTKTKEQKYLNYINNIKDYAHLSSGKFIPAYIVKIADIWDHLNEKETLTEKRKEKYLKAIPYFF